MKKIKKEYLSLGLFVLITFGVACLALIFKLSQKEPIGPAQPTVQQYQDPYQLSYRELVSSDQSLTGLVANGWLNDETVIANYFDASLIIRYQLSLIDNLAHLETGQRLAFIKVGYPVSPKQLQSEWSALSKEVKQASISLNQTPQLFVRSNTQAQTTFTQLIRPIEQNNLVKYLIVYQVDSAREKEFLNFGQFLLSNISLN